MDQIYALLLAGASSLWPWPPATPPTLSPPAIERPATDALAKQSPTAKEEPGKDAGPAQPKLRFDPRPEGRPVITCQSRSSGWSRTTVDGRVTAFHRDEPTRSDVCDTGALARPFGPSHARPRPLQWDPAESDSI